MFTVPVSLCHAGFWSSRTERETNLTAFLVDALARFLVTSRSVRPDENVAVRTWREPAAHVNVPVLALASGRNKVIAKYDSFNQLCSSSLGQRTFVSCSTCSTRLMMSITFTVAITNPFVPLRGGCPPLVGFS
jgi:hypothetical protein